MRDLRRQRCSVVGCRPSDWTTEPRRHQVPRGGALRTAWLERIGHPVTHNGNLYVCGRHFAPEDYTIYLRRVESINFKSMLRQKAVPTLHLPVIRELLAVDNSIEQASRPSDSGERDYDDIAAEPVYKAGQSLAYQSGQAVETPPQLLCEQHQVIDKSVQVGLLTHHEASQANEEKILSTSATQTEPQAVSSATRHAVAVNR
ncbi:uncharacterized protein LOC119185074 isoform X5 [Rhipicephalus microplus]|uniref:uncharacterized protein LOC119185074 isoform X5 n=1 Tax=Rhipicephalus microplus TaxID=6941 RepID=UPI003F6D19FC